MVRPIVVLAAFVALASRASGEVDFTPKESFYLAETTRVPNVAFHNGEEPMQLLARRKWTVSGGGRKVTLTPPDNSPQAERHDGDGACEWTIARHGRESQGLQRSGGQQACRARLPR